MQVRIYAFLLGVFCLPATVAAGPILCPGPAFGDAQRQFTVTTASGTAGCVSWGSGNIGGHDDDIGAGWTFLDKDSTVAEDIEPFAITGAGPTSGTFTIAPVIWTRYSEIAIAFKTGNNKNPSWAAFALPFGVLVGAWDISSNGLSHANLYATGFLGDDGDVIPPGGSGDLIPPPGPVATPEAAALALLGAGLVAARAALRRRRIS